jgi:hypothetical protein
MDRCATLGNLDWTSRHSPLGVIAIAISGESSRRALSAIVEHLRILEEAPKIDPILHVS